jgi:hypothetical protein
LGIRFEETTELQRQLLVSYSFGMLFVIGRLNKLTPPEVLALSVCMLLDVFKYSKDQAADFAEELIRSASGRGNPTTNAVIHRGIEGHRLWTARRMLELKNDLDNVLNTAGS